MPEFGDTYTVAVAGATGTTGRQVAALAGAEGWRVRSATRHAPGGGEWVRMDFDEPETWGPAFAGSDAAFLIIPFNHPGAPERMPQLLRAVAAAGVGRIVLLSSLDAAHAGLRDPLVLAEQALLQLPVRAAILRSAWLLDHFGTGSFAAMTAAGELRLPAGAGRLPFVDVRDVAAVAVAALTPGGPQGILPVTGPEQLNLRHVADALGVALRRPVRYTPGEVGEFVELLAARNYPRSYGVFLAETLNAVATGRLHLPVSGTVERVTGHRALDVDDFAANLARRLARGERKRLG
jgi:uncharacterized protein YbjT (DUF2867 family)